MSHVNRDLTDSGAVTGEQNMEPQTLGERLIERDQLDQTLGEQRTEERLMAYDALKRVPTIHNPTNFEPRDYEVEDYLDNQRPVFMGEDVEAYKQTVQWWEAEMERVLGADWRVKSHRCIHCGNGSVRWITATRHIPTGDIVVFGSACTDRLGFANKHAFKLAQLQARAEARKVKFTIYNRRAQYLVEHPEVAEMLLHVDDPQHAKNFFLKDVLNKLDQYGSLTTPQLGAIVASYAKDNERAEQKAVEALEPKGAAPSGRVTVTGVVLSIKCVDGYMPGTVAYKMLLKLENNAKVWLTCTDSSIERGYTVIVKATFEVSRDDKSFAFGKRPIVENIVKGVK